MTKTITLRIKDDIYHIIKKAADGDRRTISNFIENATLSYLTNEIYVSDIEMNEILADPDLTADIESGLNDMQKGDYEIIE
jgi:uncharacterized protein (DUF1778 family)